jgi:hypothetical protein
MKFGLPALNELSVSVVSAPSSMFVREAAAIVVEVASGNANPVALLLVVDGETSTFWRVLADAAPNAAVEFKLVPESIGVIGGQHSFALYGVDLVGTVSRAATFFAMVLQQPTRSGSPAQSARRQTRTSSRTANETSRSSHAGKARGGLRAGAIAGVSIAVVVVLVGAVAIVCFVRRRRMMAHRLTVSLSDEYSDMMRGYVGF